MSIAGSKRGSISTIRSKSTRRSSSNLALILEQSTPPTGSPVKASDPITRSPTHDRLDDDTPLNPNHNADLKKMTDLEGGAKKKRRKSRERESGWVEYARMILPHVGMVVLCILYAVAGATIFHFLERPQEQKVRNNNLQSLRRTRDQIIRELWQLTLDESTTKMQFTKAAFEKSDSYVKLLFESLDEGGYMTPAAVKDLITVNTVLNSEKNQVTDEPARNQTVIPDMWSFMGSLFFAVATLTTVGYGQIAPVTTEGRLICVAFGLLGIPLTLMTIADVGKFLGSGLKRTYRCYEKCRSTVWACLKNWRHWCSKSKNQYLLQSQDDDTGKIDDHNGNAKSIDPESKEKSNDKESEEKVAEEFGTKENIPVPVKWILFVIIVYTFVGTGLFKFTEPWSLLESFYFCFITLTTVGYGDFVPANQTYFALSLLYIVLGLAIATMSIDQTGSEYIKKVHYFGRKIQSAKKALSNVKNMISYANWVKRRYGLTDQQFTQLAGLSYGLGGFRGGSYMPECYKRLYYIDQGTESMLEEIFTITTESDQENLEHEQTAETEFPSRSVLNTFGSGQSFASPQYREHLGPWTKMKRRFTQQRSRPEFGQRSITNPNLDISMHQQHPFEELNQSRRPGVFERLGSSLSAGSRIPKSSKPFDRMYSGQGLLDTPKSGVNNNHSPKLRLASKDTINRQLTASTNEVDASLISL